MSCCDDLEYTGEKFNNQRPGSGKQLESKMGFKQADASERPQVSQLELVTGKGVMLEEKWLIWLASKAQTASTHKQQSQSK